VNDVETVEYSTRDADDQDDSPGDSQRVEINLSLEFSQAGEVSCVQPGVQVVSGLIYTKTRGVDVMTRTLGLIDEIAFRRNLATRTEAAQP
jgi:hypothetical protein